MRGKLIRKPFNTVRTRATRPLQIIHTDLCGKVCPATFDGEEYILTCHDDYIHFLKVYLLYTKDEAEDYIKEYIEESEAYFNMSSKIRPETMMVNLQALFLRIGAGIREYNSILPSLTHHN